MTMPLYPRPALAALTGFVVLGLVGCGGSESPGTGAAGATSGGGGATSIGGASGAASAAGGTTGGTGGTTAGGGSGAAGGTGGTTAGGGSGAGGTGGLTQHFGGASTATEMCETYATARADYEARCHGGDPMDWLSLVEYSCAATGRSESEGRITLDVDQAQECLAFLAGDDCGFDLSHEDNPCRSLVIGSVLEDEPCENLDFGDECAPGGFCSYIEDCIGRCRLYAGVGDTCHGNYVTAVCAPGLRCDGPSAVCLVPGAAGEACAGDGLCESGYYCDTEDGTPGTCHPSLTETPCRWREECAPGYECVANDSGEGRCVRGKAVGDTCTFGRRECERYCSLDGVCQVVAHEGEPCGSLRDPADDSLSESVTCGAGLFCNRESDSGMQGICRSQVPVGTRCPATSLTGTPCLQGDEITYCGDFGECVACGST